jgi:hypothetical protein
MKKNKSSLSKARSYAELGEYWDKHDLSDVWGKTKKVKFEGRRRAGSHLLPR